MGRLTMGDVIHVDFAQEHQKREIASEPFILFTTEAGQSYTFTIDTEEEWEPVFTIEDGWTEPLTPEDFPLPETELTLFGWSVSVFDHTQRQWFTLPDFYRSEAAALTVAEAYLLAIDFNPWNDNGDYHV